MTETHALAQAATKAEKRFSALLTPHRSLPPRGFFILMCAVGLVSFVAGMAFLMMGAWPVMGFFGLDVALIYVAFKLNYRAGRAYERVELDDEALTVTRVTPAGKSRSWRFNPYWVRVAVSERIGRTNELSIGSHGDRLVFGAFLTDAERIDLARALQDALRTASLSR